MPPVQSGVSPAAGGGGGRGGDPGCGARPRRRRPAVHRHASAADPQGDRGPHRRPAAGSGVARVAVADQGRCCHHRGDRRRDPPRLRLALGADGAVRDLPDRRRRRRHQALHRAVRPRPAVGLVTADRRPRVDRGPGRTDREPVRPPVRRLRHSATGAQTRRQSGCHPARPEEERPRRRRHDCAP